jgi:hypothetical protein
MLPDVWHVWCLHSRFIPQRYTMSNLLLNSLVSSHGSVLEIPHEDIME